MGATTAIRLLFGLMTFALLARMLGPASFGVLMLWLAIATLASLVANYGFTPYLLREICANPGSANLVMNEVFSAKLLVSSGVFSLSLTAMPFIAAEIRWIFLLLLLAMLADSTTDFLNVGYRATNRFSSETRIATVAAAFQFALVGGLVWYSATVMQAAIAFVASRTCVLIITWLNQKQYFAQLRPAPVGRAVRRLKQAASYAMDFGLQSLIGHIDSLVLNYFLGPIAVGLHQAGMRLFLGGGQFANVLGNVFVPRVSSVVSQGLRLDKQAEQLQRMFFGTGAAFGLALAIGADSIVHLLFGDQFAGLAALLPWFGLLFFVRFFAAAYGVLLTAAGKQTLRAQANLTHWILILAVAWVLVPRLGNLGWLLALTIGNVLLASIYFSACRPLATGSRLNLAFASLSLIAFAPFLRVV